MMFILFLLLLLMMMMMMMFLLLLMMMMMMMMMTKCPKDTILLNAAQLYRRSDLKQYISQTNGWFENGKLNI